MKHLTEFLNESIANEAKVCPKCHHNPCTCEEEEVGYTEEELEMCKECGFTEEEVEKAEETIKNEKDFKEACKAKFKKAFGDKLDEDKMNKTIDGMLKDHKEEVEKGDWGKLMGMMNKSFGA